MSGKRGAHAVRGFAFKAGVSIMALFIGDAAMAQAAPNAEARSALERAEAARDAAMRALDAANAAIEQARTLIARPATAPGTTSSPPVADPNDICTIGAETPAILADVPARENRSYHDQNPVNEFTFRCLGLKERSALSVTDLNGQLQVTSTTTTAEVVPSYTRFYRTPMTDGRTRVSYHKFRLGASIPLDKGGKSATFADLSQPNLSNEVSLVAGFEYGRVHVNAGVARDATIAALRAARRDCLAFVASEPFRDPLADGGRILIPRTEAEVLSACDGVNLSNWMRDHKRGQTYYDAIVKPLWQPNPSSTLLLGVEGRYGRATRSFFPLRDPANTGIPLMTSLPADFPKTSSSLTRDLFSVKVYGSTTFSLSPNPDAEKTAAVGISIAYRRDMQFPNGTTDQIICPPSTGAYVSCPSITVAPPYVLQGWVVGGRFAIKIPRFFYLPEMGFEAKLTYALDTKQLGLEFPLYAFADAEGKTQGGVSLNCTNNGQTSNGYPLKGECKAVVFIGRKFELGGRP